MKILYSLPFWPYLYTPWLFREVAWMRQRGHEVAVISLGDPPGPPADLSDFGLEDVPVLQVRQQYTSDRGLLRELASMGPSSWRSGAGGSLSDYRREAGTRQGVQHWAVMKRVLAFVRKHEPDVIEAHWAAHSAILASDIKKELGIPFAVRFHGGDLYRNPSPNLQRIVTEADALCPVSEFLVRLLKGDRPVEALPQVPAVTFDESKVHVCHNGIPGDAIGTEPAPQSDDEVVVGTIGRLDPEKRHADLIEAVSRLKDKHAHLQLRLIGGGMLEPDLCELAEQRQVTDRVTITGSLPWAKVMEERGRLHIYAQASEVEGCSLAIAEGLGQGLPAILSRTGAAESSVEEGVSGYTYDIGDIDTLVARLDELASASAEQRRRMGAASLEVARRCFLVDRQMEKVEGILQAISAKAAATR